MKVTNEIKFYRSKDAYGYLSNLYPLVSGLEFEGRYFRSSEEAYQYGKPSSKKLAEWIISAPEQKYVAFAAHSLVEKDIVPYWNDIKVERMYNVLKAKFDQHEGLKMRLIATEDKILIEDSPIDSFWGCGEDGTGANTLGVLLMKIREEYAK